MHLLPFPLTLSQSSRVGRQEETDSQPGPEQRQPSKDIRLKWAQPESSIWFSDWIKQSIILSSPFALSRLPLVLSLSALRFPPLHFPFASCKFYWPHFWQAESQVQKGNDCRHHSTEDEKPKPKKGNKSVWENIKISHRVNSKFAKVFVVILFYPICMQNKNK